MGAIDLYYLPPVNSNAPIEESVGALADLVREGKVRHIGLFEGSASTLQQAHTAIVISSRRERARAR